MFKLTNCSTWIQYTIMVELGVLLGMIIMFVII